MKFKYIACCLIGSMLFALFSFCAVAEDSIQTVAVTDETVTTFGRTYYKDGLLHCNWTNSGFSFCFTGTAASAAIQTSNTTFSGTFLDVYVDDSSEPLVLKLGNRPKEVVLAENLENTKHTIRVVKRSENGWGGTAAIEKLMVQGQFEQSPAKPTRAIEVIGDSITCGYGNLADGNRINTYRPQDQEGTKTYATYMAAEFGAQCNVISKSGIGFAFNSGGGTTNTMRDVYPYTDYFNLGTDTLWDFEKNSCDVVVIALGTNDTSAPSAQAYYEGAKAFLQMVREKNPDSYIIWAYEIMTASYNQELRKVIEESNEAGDNKVFYHTLGLMDKTTDGVGAAGHPSMATHEKDGAGLADFVAQITGWERAADVPAQLTLQENVPLRFANENMIIINPVSTLPTAEQIKTYFKNSDSITVAMSNQSPIAPQDPVSTGSLVMLLQNGQPIDTRIMAVLGDVDGNGSINASDALAILKHAVHKEILTGPALAAAHSSGNDTISAADALQVLKFAVQKIQTFTP